MASPPRTDFERPRTDFNRGKRVLNARRCLRRHACTGRLAGIRPVCGGAPTGIAQVPTNLRTLSNWTYNEDLHACICWNGRLPTHCLMQALAKCAPLRPFARRPSPCALVLGLEGTAVVAARHPLRSALLCPRRQTLPAGCRLCAAVLQKGLRSELWMPYRAPDTACTLACSCLLRSRPHRAPRLPRAYNALLRLPPRLRHSCPAGRHAQRLCCGAAAAAARRNRAGPDGQANRTAQACRPVIVDCGRHMRACLVAWRRSRRPSYHA